VIKDQVVSYFLRPEKLNPTTWNRTEGEGMRGGALAFRSFGGRRDHGPRRNEGIMKDVRAARSDKGNGWN